MRKKKSDHLFQNLILVGTALFGTYIAMRGAASRHIEPKNMDEGNPYFQKKPDKDNEKHTVYESIIKPAADKMLSFGGLILLLPVYAAVSLAIYLDDPGPVFFTQKRVGKGKNFFELHKFRSMKMSAPHDVPTHQLANPEQYITRVGKVLRKTSLDELPQIWDIFRGKMSIIGPRPALWNQEDLIEERDKYGANDVFPGLTGLAQIKGRDELEIADKAKLDGKYVSTLRKGGMAALVQDVKCFAATIFNVLKHDGVIEGGTGKLYSNRTADSAGIALSPEEGADDYGFKKKFHIDKMIPKYVLITGANSYIGESFRKYANVYYPNLMIDTLDMIGNSWENYDFSRYDTVFHVAGIAHADVGKADEVMKAKYYTVNTDLAIKTAKAAKAAGVKQFLFMSSIIIYGDSAPYGKEKIIDEHTVPAPANFYGDSKWQADKGVRELKSDNFAVAVLRPPMIYGKGSKGNYMVLSKLAERLPIFPDAGNQRSMLYIDNFCEFVSLLILSGEGGIYFPQNEEYSMTAEMVKGISEAAGNRIHLTRLLNPAVRIASYVPGKISRLVNKAFGNMTYDQQLSAYHGLDYRVVDLHTSITLTES